MAHDQGGDRILHVRAAEAIDDYERRRDSNGGCHAANAEPKIHVS